MGPLYYIMGILLCYFYTRCCRLLTRVVRIHVQLVIAKFLYVFIIVVGAEASADVDVLFREEIFGKT